jgi:hypothetical protein
VGTVLNLIGAVILVIAADFAYGIRQPRLKKPRAHRLLFRPLARVSGKLWRVLLRR